MASTIPAASYATGSSTGSGLTVDFLTAKKNVTAVIVPSATLTDGVVHIEASQDGANWVALRTVDVSARAPHAVHSSGVAFRYWRASIVREVAGGTVRVTFMEAD